jgi:hypothetical protein
VANSLQEYLLKRVAAVRKPPYLEVLARHQPPDAIQFHTGRKNDAPVAAAFGDTSALFRDRRSVLLNANASGISCTPAVGPPLLFQIGVVDNGTSLEDDYLVADLFHIPQKMRTEDHAHSVLLCHFPDQLQHASARGGVSRT